MLTVAVSGINAVDNPGPGTGIVRALKESSLEVRAVGLAYDSMEPGIYMTQIIDKAYVLPYPSSDRRLFLGRLREIHARENIDVIISALDAELPIYMEIEGELRRWGIKMLIPSRHAFQEREKTKLDELATRIGVKCPEFRTCTSFRDLRSALNDIEAPRMVKGPFYEAYKAASDMEAEEYFLKLANKWGFPIIIQEFVSGEEYDVVGCGDGEGGNMGLFAMKKMTTTALGKVWNAVSIRNEELLALASRFVEHLCWRGGFEMEVIIEDKNREIYLLEANPRFPAWVYMAAACGINLPERMVRLLMGMSYEDHSRYESGKMMIRFTAEMLKDITDFEQVVCSGESNEGPRDNDFGSAVGI
ncbi:MAG: ATP-grasp domain-containing protein [Deltaproteobacteria bacterium]|jgi:carbamoyl-phosphate synthase large subunit|nr:ATP-grasp domain-containing protein [Deltaproteobacteria bacterium]